MDREKERRIEEVLAQVPALDRAISELHDDAFAFCGRERAADRADVFRMCYERAGARDVEPRLGRMLATLREVDPERTAIAAWAEVLESQGVYHANLARQTIELRRRVERILERPSSPFADSDEAPAFVRARQAYEELVSLLGADGWKHGRMLGELRWRLGDRDGALAMLTLFNEHQERPSARVEAREIIAEIEEHESRRVASPVATSPACIIATACVGADAAEVAALRRARDEAIVSDPIARDFFHVFWSRYYEWSPAVARLAASDPSIAAHIRWSFLEPWLAWVEMVSLLGARPLAELAADERDDALTRLTARIGAWLAELPGHLEGKAPPDAAQVVQTVERFRCAVRNGIRERRAAPSVGDDTGGGRARGIAEGG